MALTESEAKLQVGDEAPDFALMGIDGATHRLADYKGKAFLIIFMCNHCPFVKQKFDTINELAKRDGLVVIGINPNDAETHPEDSFEKMVELAREKGFVFDYLRDETQEVAKAYGAVCTPDPFLFDGEKRLAWQGRIDDALQLNAEATQHDMAEAIEAVLAGKPVDKPFLPSMGCNIKWK